MKINISKDKLVSVLADLHKIDPKKIKEISETARKEKKSVFQLLCEQASLTEDIVYNFLSESLAIPLINLPSLRITSDLIKLVPKKIIERYQILPLSKIGNLISIATSDPFNLLVIDDLKEIAKCNVCMVLVPPKQIATAIENYYGNAATLDQILEGMEDTNLEFETGKEDDGGDPKTAASEADNAPVVRMVDLILTQGIKSRASDIHFEPYERDFRVRFRIDGHLKESMRQSPDLYGPLVSRIKIMSQLNITEKRLPQDGRFRVHLSGKEIDFRVSILPIYHGEKVVLRVLDRSGMKTGLDQLGFSEKPTKAFANAIKKPYGMVLVTGPTGSGKSTTLYTILNTLNTVDRNIMTIEDPIEYQVHGITQTQARAEVGLTFASGLRCLLRQSPDVILVGEIRDGETADIAVKAALTGHLVFSTLHTNSAAGAVTRLIDMKVEPFLIASSVVCVAAQRLIRRICQYCKASCEVHPDVIRRCGLKPEDLKGVDAFKGAGCAKCNNSGYFGRIATIEVLTVDSDIRDMIIQRKSSDEIHEAAVEKGMESLFLNAFSLFKRGLTTLEEVLRVTSKE